MAESLEDAIALFSSDDGSLPEVEFEVPDPDAIRESYLFIQSCSSRIQSKDDYYWSKSKDIAVRIAYGDDPVTALNEGEAESFHLVFGGVVSPSGHEVPPLGLFVFTDAIAIDYQMGEGWSLESIVGFFEILDRVADITGVSNFVHRENDNDEGDKLFRIWTSWRTNRAA